MAVRKKKQISRLFYFTLLAIFIGAFLVRLIGLYPGYPDNHPDEPTSYSTAIYMFYNFLKPGRVDYPAGMPFIHLIVYLSLFIPPAFTKLLFFDPTFFSDFKQIGFDAFTTHKDFIFGAREIYALYWSRYISALFGAFAVVLVFFTGKKLFNFRVGIFTAFLLAFSYRHVLGSHFGLPDVHNSFFTLLAVFGSALILEKPTFRRYLFAGAVIAITVAIKYQIFVFAPFLIVHMYWAYKKRNFIFLFNKGFLMTALLVPAVFLALNPFAFIDIDAFVKRSEYTALRYQMGSDYFRPYSLFYLYYWGMGVLPTIGVVAGMILMLRRSFIRFLLMSSIVFPFFYVMVYYSNGGIYPRNFVTVIPLLLLYAGYAVDCFYQFVSSRHIRWGLGITIFLLCVINIIPIRDSIVLSYGYAQPWNSVTLARWIEKKLPRDVTIRNYQLFSPAETQMLMQKKHIKQKDWDYLKGPNSLAEFKEEGTDFAILNTESFLSITYWWRGHTDPLFYVSNGQIPFEYIENSFFGLTIKELIPYAVHEVFKPWQAYESNFIVYKIPPKPKKLGRRIVYFDFTKNAQGWKVIDPYKEGALQMKAENGIITAKASANTSRITSKPILVKRNTVYCIRGKVNTKKLDGLRRDGFFRIDFYANQLEAMQGGVGEHVGISPRAPARDAWVHEEVCAKASDTAKYMTASFQFKETYSSASIDDVGVYEGAIFQKTRFKDVPYIRPLIPQESIYYSSFI